MSFDHADYVQSIRDSRGNSPGPGRKYVLHYLNYENFHILSVLIYNECSSLLLYILVKQSSLEFDISLDHDELLIDMVRGFSYLCDKLNPQYKNVEMKNYAWNSIAKVLNMTGKRRYDSSFLGYSTTMVCLLFRSNK